MEARLAPDGSKSAIDGKVKTKGKVAKQPSYGWAHPSEVQEEPNSGVNSEIAKTPGTDVLNIQEVSDTEKTEVDHLSSRKGSKPKLDTPQSVLNLDAQSVGKSLESVVYSKKSLFSSGGVGNETIDELL